MGLPESCASHCALVPVTLAASWGFSVPSLHQGTIPASLWLCLHLTTGLQSFYLCQKPAFHPLDILGFLIPASFPDRNPGHFTCPVMRVELWWSSWDQPSRLSFPDVQLLMRQMGVVVIFTISTHCHESLQMSEIGNCLGEWGKISLRRSRINWVVLDE